jgi:aminopeptidase YwaD
MSLAPSASGTLVVATSAADAASVAGQMAVLDAPYDPRVSGALLRAGATAVIVAATAQVEGAWTELAQRPPPGVEIEGLEAPPPTPRPVIFARAATFAALKAAAGETATLSAPRGEPQLQTTHNVLGVIRGTAADADRQAILLSAHYDHVGLKDGVLYPGANDDASGTAAVLEFARLLSRETASKRSVHFALFGCEEQGGHGAKAFLAKPPLPLSDIAANLEFEMIGLPDPKHPKTLMLTGWERSNLGPTLKAQGADIGPDPYPEQNFFQRSDNYQLALKGVVAQTVSAWPVPPTYHQPSDTVESVDLKFMAQVIQSLIGPIQWLANSDFRPEWNPGMKP